jgi:hypothetical protein
VSELVVAASGSADAAIATEERTPAIKNAAAALLIERFMLSPLLNWWRSRLSVTTSTLQEAKVAVSQAKTRRMQE